MKTLLILQNSAETPAGTTIEWCRQHGIESHTLKLWNAEDPFEKLKQLGLTPSDSKQWGLVICGGGMNVDEEHLHPWLRNEKLFIKSALEHNIRTLGLCLGAQLMAEVLGAQVGPHSHWEVGWHTIQLNPHPLLPAETKTLTAFQWHRYTFAIPQGAIPMGHSPACANQGFFWKAHGLGVQFHPESTTDWIKECCETELDEYPQGPFAQPPHAILSQLEDQVRLLRWYWELLDRFFAPQR